DRRAALGSLNRREAIRPHQGSPVRRFKRGAVSTGPEQSAGSPDLLERPGSVAQPHTRNIKTTTRAIPEGRRNRSPHNAQVQLRASQIEEHAQHAQSLIARRPQRLLDVTRYNPGT